MHVNDGKINEECVSETVKAGRASGYMYGVIDFVINIDLNRYSSGEGCYIEFERCDKCNFLLMRFSK